MLIEEWMVRPVHVVKPLDSILHAREAMTRHRVNQLPVVRDGKLIGIVTDRDLRDAFPSVFDSVARELDEEIHPRRRGQRKPAEAGADPAKITVELVMTHNILTLGPKDTVEKAAGLMRSERIGAVPIVDGARLVGILTRSDILGAFLGLARAGAELDGG